MNKQKNEPRNKQKVENPDTKQSTAIRTIKANASSIASSVPNSLLSCSDRNQYFVSISNSNTIEEIGIILAILEI